jgi:osmotically-inducible protein OsmY
VEYTPLPVPDRDPPPPKDPGPDAADVAIAQHIREVIAATGTLSVNAKNIKIVSRNGAVTLRGPVETSDESAYIASIAQTTAGVSSVDNQLEVAIVQTRDTTSDTTQ